MIRLLFTLFVILYFSYFICDSFNISFGKSVPIVYVYITLIQYFAALLGKLSYFKYFLLLSLVFITVCLYSKYKFDIRRYFKNKKYFIPSVIIFVIVFSYLYFLLNNVELSNIDDLGYWGTRLKDMFRNDSLYAESVGGYAVFDGIGYPPFTHLLEISFMKMMGGFDYSYALLALSSFSFSFFLPLFDEYKFEIKDSIKIVFMLFGIFCLLLSVQQNSTNENKSLIFNSLYVDWLLSIVLMYGFYTIYTNNFDEIISYINLCMCGFVLIFTKQIGAALFLLLLATALIHLILTNNINYKNITKYIIFVVIIPLFVFLTWKIYSHIVFNVEVIASLETSNFANIGIEGKNIANIMYDCFGEQNINTIKKFILFYFNETIIRYPFEASYFVVTTSIFSILLVIGISCKKEKNYYVIPCMYYLGSVAYALGILLAYLFEFGYDGTTMPLFGRYMQTYSYFGLLLAMYILFNNNKNKNHIIIVSIVCSLFVNIGSLDTIVYKKNRINYRENEISKINNWIQHEYNYEPMIVVNQTDMVYLSLFKNTFEEKNRNITYKQFTKEDSLESFEEMLSKNEFILIGDFDMIFKDYFWSKLSNVNPYNNSLYKIINNDGQYSFELIYTWDK